MVKGFLIYIFISLDNQVTFSFLLAVCLSVVLSVCLQNKCPSGINLESPSFVRRFRKVWNPLKKKLNYAFSKMFQNIPLSTLFKGIKLETVHDISPIIVKRAAVLSKLFSYLGKSEKLGLSGRGDTDVGILTTSIFYKIQGKTFVFTPQSLDHMTNYIDTDPSLAMSTLAYGLNYMSTSWTELGRPTITLILGHSMVENGKIPQPYITTLRP